MNVHGKNFCPNSDVTACNGQLHDATQKTLPLAFGVHRAPTDAPAKVLRQIESEAQALAVAIAAGHHKVAYIAACIGKSHAYVSLMQSGKRAIPDRLIGPLCAATGSNLLRQFHQLQTALGEVCEVERLADLLRTAA
jgi:hypothetical protein